MVYPIIEFRKYTHASLQKCFKNKFSVKLRDAESPLKFLMLICHSALNYIDHIYVVYLGFEFES